MTESDITSSAIRKPGRTIPGLIYVAFKTVWSFMVWVKVMAKLECHDLGLKKLQKILSDTLALTQAQTFLSVIKRNLSNRPE